MSADDNLQNIQDRHNTDKQKVQNARRLFLAGRYIAAAVIILLLVFGLGAKYSVYINGLPATAADIPGIEAVSDFTATVPDGNIIVAVSGEVANKGYFSITPDITMRDILDFAGTRRDSDVSAIDFAHIPLHGDRYHVRSAADPLDIEPWLQNDWSSQTSESPDAAATGPRVDLNTATLEELMELPGIGEVKAQAIIDYRIEHNGFSYKEELLGVKGIGNKIYENIIDQVTV